MFRLYYIFQHVGKFAIWKLHELTFTTFTRFFRTHTCSMNTRSTRLYMNISETIKAHARRENIPNWWQCILLAFSYALVNEENVKRYFNLFDFKWIILLLAGASRIFSFRILFSMAKVKRLCLLSSYPCVVKCTCIPAVYSTQKHKFLGMSMKEIFAM